MAPDAINKLVLTDDAMTNECKSPTERLISYTPKD
jgi:hypothetical protein